MLRRQETQNVGNVKYLNIVVAIVTNLGCKRCVAPKSLMKQLAQMKSEFDGKFNDPINAQNIVDRFKEVVTDVADKDIVWGTDNLPGHSSFSDPTLEDS